MIVQCQYKVHNSIPSDCLVVRIVVHSRVPCRTVDTISQYDPPLLGLRMDTHERLVSSVRSHMDIQMSLLGKALPTMRKRTGVLSSLPRPRHRLVNHQATTRGHR